MNARKIIADFNLNSTEFYGFNKIEPLSYSEEWQTEEKRRSETFSTLNEHSLDFTNDIKKNARHGIPAILRRKLWIMGSGAAPKLMNENPEELWQDACSSLKEYRDDIALRFGSVIDIPDYIVAPLHDQYYHFLQVVANSYKFCHFAPLLPIVSLMLLTYLEPPLAFFVLATMFERSEKDQAWFFTTSQEDFIGSLQAFRDLANSRCTKIVHHAEKLGINVGQLFSAIFPLFFFPFMPMHISFTIFDSFISEGRKILVRLSLSLFFQEKASLLAAKTPKEFIGVFVHAIQQLASLSIFNNFLQKSFKTFLSRNAHMAYFEKTVQTDKHGLLTRLSRERFNGIEHNIMEPASHKMSTSRSTELSIDTISEDFDYFHILDEYVDVIGHTVDHMLYTENDDQKAELAQMEIQKAIFGSHLPSIYGGTLLSDLIYFRLRGSLPKQYINSSISLVFSTFPSNSQSNQISEKSERPQNYEEKSEHSQNSEENPEQTQNENNINSNNTENNENEMQILGNKKEDREVKRGGGLAGLYEACNEEGAYLLVVKTNSRIFGVFTNCKLEIQPEYYGKKSCFIFMVNNYKLAIFKHKYPPNHCFIKGSEEELAFGGPSPAISLNSELNKMKSFNCMTYHSHQLTKDEEDDIDGIEVYKVLEDPIPPIAIVNSQSQNSVASSNSKENSSTSEH